VSDCRSIAVILRIGVFEERIRFFGFLTNTKRIGFAGDNRRFQAAIKTTNFNKKRSAESIFGGSFASYMTPNR
jgi:hypothetical protein